jgi:hypothetical protein
VILLSDGTEVRGRITAEDGDAYAVKVGGSLRLVEKKSVKEVRRGAPAAEAPAPGEAPPAAGEPPTRKRERRRGPDEATPEPAALSAEAAAWGRVCIDRLLGADPSVRRSAAEAIRALGPAAAPLLREARQGAGEAGRIVLDELARSLEKRRERSADGAPKPGTPADPSKAAPPRGRAVLDRVRTELGLDPEQTRAVSGRLVEFGRSIRETMADARDGLVSYEDAKAKGDALRAKLREDLKGSLTEEQIGKLDGILDAMAPGRKKGPPPKDGAPQ